MQSRKGWNPRIGFKQSIKHFEYLWKVHNEIKYLTSKYPHICKTIKRGKLFYSLQFETRQLECLKEIRSLFYIDISPNKYVRSLNINQFNYKNYLVLAHWIKGDGTKPKNGGKQLCTNGFTLEEVIMQINILIIKFNINPILRNNKTKDREKEYKIYIRVKDYKNIICPNIKQYFVKSKYYKLD